jgi:hypothetical protein
MGANSDKSFIYAEAHTVYAQAHGFYDETHGPQAV